MTTMSVPESTPPPGYETEQEPQLKASVDPLDYLSAPERLLCGGLVRRIFVVNAPRTARSIERDGPEAAAIGACGRVVQLYGAGLAVLGIVFAIAHAFPEMYACFALIALCGVYMVARAPSVAAASKRYKQARGL
jgi:hypothetical protein